MSFTVLLLTDSSEDARDLMPAFPVSSYRLLTAPLKETGPRELIPIHPDVILVDATQDVAVAEDITFRTLALAWEIGLPPIIVVVSEDTVARFRFEVGADDFLLTDASLGEISTRVAMSTRKSGDEDSGVLKIGDLTVNPENYQVYVRGRPLDLTYKEFELLKFLAQRPGRVCTRDLLLREVWGYDYYGGTRTVDVHIRRLRAKLGAEHEALIETIRNVGYRLVPRPRERSEQR